MSRKFNGAVIMNENDKLQQSSSQDSENEWEWWVTMIKNHLWSDNFDGNFRVIWEKGSWNVKILAYNRWHDSLICSCSLFMFKLYGDEVNWGIYQLIIHFYEY